MTEASSGIGLAALRWQGYEVKKIRITKEERISIMMIFGFIFAVCCAAVVEAVVVNNKMDFTK